MVPSNFTVMVGGSGAGRQLQTASAQRVLDGALELFAQQGYGGTSLQQIADQLGVTKAAVYYHFKAKADILNALTEPAVADLQSLLRRAESTPLSGRASQEQFLHDLVDFLLRHRQLAAFLARDVGALSQPDLWATASTLGGQAQALLIGRGGQPADRLGAFWGVAVFGALIAGPLALPDADASWMRGQLIELGRTVRDGYRKAARAARQ